jgi:uncharacterized phage protein gp47/JayE
MLNDLIIPKTRDEIRANIIASLQADGFPATNWSTTSAARGIIDPIVEALFLYGQQIPDIASLGVLDYSSGTWLTQLGKNYGLTRIQAIKTQRTLRITDTFGTDTPNTNQPNTIWIRDNSGRQFVNVNTFTIPHLGYVDVLFEAEVGGSAHNSISSGYSFITSKIGCVISEPSIAISQYGSEEEFDVAFRKRIVAKLNSTSNGLSEANFINWMQVINPSVSDIYVNAGYFAGSPAPGGFEIYAAKSDRSALSSPELSALTTTMLNKLPTGMLVSVFNATTHTVNITGTVMLPYYAVAPAQTAGLKAIADLQSAIKIGGNISFQQIHAAVLKGVNTNVYSSNITAPLADINLADKEVVLFNTSGLVYDTP